MNLKDSYDRMVSRSGKPSFSTGTKGVKPKMQILPLSKLNIDDSYQRYLSKRVFDKAKMFDFSLARPLSVFLRPSGKYYVNDGQHTALMAMLSEGIKEIECLVLEHSKDYDDEQCRFVESKHFELLNTSRKNISLIDRYRAEASYGDKEALKFVENLKILGLQVEGLGDDVYGYNLVSPTKMEWAWRHHDLSTVKDAVDFMVDKDKKVWKKGHINGALALGVTKIFDFLSYLNGGEKGKGLKYFMNNNFEKKSQAEWIKGCQGSLGQILLFQKIIKEYNLSLDYGQPGSPIGDSLLRNLNLTIEAKQ